MESIPFQQLTNRAQLIQENLIDIKNDGSFRLNQKFFDYATGLTMTNKMFDDLFNNKPRDPEREDLNQFHICLLYTSDAADE